MGWLAVPKDWIGSFGEIVKFCSRIVGEVFTLKVLRFFGEALRQAGILILSSTIVIWGLIFIIGLQCGIEGAYFNRSVGSPAYAGVFAAWCDLRELVPYAFGYMMSAKVGTGIVAELGSMRISDEIDALEVMGIPSLTFLCATKLLAAWLVLPFMYLAGIGAGFFASYLAVVQQIGEVSSGGFFLIFWMFQNPPDLLYSVIKAMSMATVHRARRLLLRLQRERRPGRGRHRDGEVDGAQHRARAPDRHAGDTALLGRQSTRANRRLNGDTMGRIFGKDKDDDTTRAAARAGDQPRAAQETQPAETSRAGGHREGGSSTRRRRPRSATRTWSATTRRPSATARPTTSTSGTRAPSARPACRTRSSSSRCTRRSGATRSCAA